MGSGYGIAVGVWVCVGAPTDEGRRLPSSVALSPPPPPPFREHPPPQPLTPHLFASRTGTTKQFEIERNELQEKKNRKLRPLTFFNMFILRNLIILFSVVHLSVTFTEQKWHVVEWFLVV